MRFDRRLIQYFDWGLLALTLALAGIGLMTLYSAVTAGEGGGQELLYYKQLVWYGAGFAAMVICFALDYKIVAQWAYPIYVACNLLLVGVLLFGRLVAGSRRWLALGPVSVQPSELMKIGLILLLASYYAKRLSPSGFTLRELFLPLLMVAVPFALIARQPDLGTGLMLVLIAGFMTFFAKIERKSLWVLIGGAALALPSAWFMLKGYQKQRILTFLDPNRDPLGAGYHIIQSKIAIGSGMVTGKGYLQGSQNILAFLPEQHTDFIFSVLAEEWGFIGAFVTLFLFLLFIIWGLNVAYACRDGFGTLLAVGLTAMIFWQVLINISMVMGLMPVVGMPLPFISYGGSSVITVMIGVGLLLNVSMRRFPSEG